MCWRSLTREGCVLRSWGVRGRAAHRLACAVALAEWLRARNGVDTEEGYDSR